MDDQGSENRGILVNDIAPFCDQLEKFIEYIAGVRDLNFLTYEYPNVLKNRLDTDVLELETTLGEMKMALINAERLKTQRKSIKLEKISVKKILKRIRDEELREMESVISTYDKSMFSRWEMMKTTTQKPEALELMLMEIKGKQLALENLTVLVSRKLDQIQVFKPQNNCEINEKNSLRIMGEKSVIPLPFPSFCTPIIPIPPPLPPPPMLLQAPVSNVQKRSYPQRLSIQRRRRMERREENLERRSHNAEDLSSVSLTLSDLPNNLSVNLFPTILNPISNSGRDFVSDNSGAGSIVRSLNINEDNNNNEVRGRLGSEFQSEMRTVLQALFGDLGSTPTLLVAESTSSNVAEAENTPNTNPEIELYALRKTQ